LAETINGLYKAELIHRRAPWKTKEAVELATLECPCSTMELPNSGLRPLDDASCFLEMAPKVYLYEM